MREPDDTIEGTVCQPVGPTFYMLGKLRTCWGVDLFREAINPAGPAGPAGYAQLFMMSADVMNSEGPRLPE